MPYTDRKYFPEAVPALGEEEDAEKELAQFAKDAISKFEEKMDALEPHVALESLWSLIRRTNKYLDSTAPWTLAKNQDYPRLARVLYTVGEVLRIVSVALTPILPDTAGKIRAQLDLPAECKWEDAYVWNGWEPEKKILKEDPIFPRIEIEKEEETAPKAEKKEEKPQEPEKPQEEEISFDDFLKVHLKVATVLVAERVEGSDKLLRLEVDLGSEKRQIVAGIGKAYAPEELLGKQIAVVTNLKPRKIFGLLSEAMILAADDGGKLAVLNPEKTVKAGSVIG